MTEVIKNLVIPNLKKYQKLTKEMILHINDVEQLPMYKYSDIYNIVSSKTSYYFQISYLRLVSLKELLKKI
ncbi:MAG: hypothetical protein IJ848_01495 [Alphaproteobacteria bacterium]|nr:hypothetical protein [Alphaproteobacteria bacterium]